MRKKTKIEHVPNQMESDIIAKIGRNNTNEKSFIGNIFIDEPSYNQIIGFYTYRGEVCILDGLGMDVTFSTYSEKNQNIIHEVIMSNKYE